VEPKDPNSLTAEPQEVTFEPIPFEAAPTVTEIVSTNPDVTPTITKTPTSEVTLTNLDSEVIFAMVNSYRTGRGLPAFEQNAEVCSLAEVRSVELKSEATNGTIHAGLYVRPLPYWIFENAKYGSDEAGTFAWWISSPLHHSSIVGDYKYSCVRCSGNYCAQLFTSFTPK
jgi:uncharacterized protein YkwD